MENHGRNVGLQKKVNEYMQANGIKKKFVKTDGTDEERDSEGAFRPFLI